MLASTPRPRKKCDIVEGHLRNHGFLSDRPLSRASSSYQKYLPGTGEKRFEDGILRSPFTLSCRSGFHRSYSSASDVDSVMLQSQVTTLQWQLRQAEASRQMYRAVMEQVMAFLQKTHRSLDALQGQAPDGDPATVARVPRSRSVHGVDSSPQRCSPPPPDLELSFQKAKSFAQIGDPDCPKHGAMFRDASWRRARKHQRQQQQHVVDEINPSKLSEEAFRLLRTVKSLLSTKEPDLASRLSTSCPSPANPADASSASSTVSAALDSDASDHSHLALPPKDPRPETPRPGTSDPRRRHSLDPKLSPPHLSLSSADDESGFSSLNSFQEVGLPVPAKSKAAEAFQSVGLPSVDGQGCKVHRRWSSTPADTLLAKLRPPSLCTDGEVVRVLWV